MSAKKAAEAAAAAGEKGEGETPKQNGEKDART